jgi:uncharacterized protein
VSSASASETCPRLDGLPTRELAGGLRVAEARARVARMKGLARLDSLPRSTGLHIPGCAAIHTFTMRFPLDLIWLDRRGQVVRVDRDVPPKRMKAYWRARSVVEVNGGAADEFLAAGLA